MAPSPKRRRAGWLPWLAGGPFLVLALSAVAARAESSTPGCMAWPGEPTPLPDVRDADALAAQWSRDRAARLSQLAVEIEPLEPDAAHRLRAHALCLDPERELDRQALATRLPVQRSSLRPMLRSLDDSRLAEIDAGLAAATRDLEAARFREVLERSPRLRAMLGALEVAPAVLRRQTTLELLAATAYTALGRDDEATQSMARALTAQPELELSREASPKLQPVLARVRSPRSAVR